MVPQPAVGAGIAFAGRLWKGAAACRGVQDLGRRMSVLAGTLNAPQQMPFPSRPAPVQRGERFG